MQVDDYDDEPRRGGRGGGGAPIAIDLPTGRNMLKYLNISPASPPFHSEESLFPNNHLWPLLLFFWLKWAGYLAVAGLNLLAQISDRRSPSGV